MPEPATDSDRFPRVAAYLAGLPRGLATCPQHLAKASSLRAGLRVLPLDAASLVGAPPRLRALVEHPPLDSMWITEVENRALSLLIADVYGLDRLSFGRLCYDAMTGLVRSSLYSAILRSIPATMRLRTMASRWSSFHRGVELTATQTEHGLQLDLDFPTGLVPKLCVDRYTQVWQAVIDHSRSRTATARLVCADERTARYSLDGFRRGRGWECRDVRDSRTPGPAMTSNGFLVTSRRHFIHTTAAASATALWAGSASAGPAPGIVPTNFALEIDGSMIGWLSSVEMAEHIGAPTTKGGVFGLGPFSASYPVSDANPLVLDWIMALARKQASTKNGAIVLADFNYVARRRVSFTDALVTSVRFSKLSAHTANPFLVEFAWQPSTVSHTKASGKVSAPTTKGAKPTTGTFRLIGLPAESNFVTGIVLPSIAVPNDVPRKGKAKPEAKVGDVAIEFSGRSYDSLYKYVEGVIGDGKLTDDERLDLAVEVLDPSLKKAMATVQLFGCGLRSYKEGTLEAGKDSAKITLTFSVDRFDLKV